MQLKANIDNKNRLSRQQSAVSSVSQSRVTGGGKSPAASSEDSYQKAIRKRREKKLYKEMAQQNQMIESIKEKLREKNLELSPKGSPEHCRMRKSSSSGRGSLASSKDIFGAKEVVAKDLHELSNGSNDSPANCADPVELSQNSYGPKSHFKTDYKYKGTAEPKYVSLKPLRPGDHFKTPPNNLRRGRDAKQKVKIKKDDRFRATSDASNKGSIAYRLKDYLTGKKKKNEKMTPKPQAKRALDTSQDRIAKKVQPKELQKKL